MNINIKATGMELAGDVEEYVRKKLAALERFGHVLGKDAQLHLILSKVTNHHKTGAEAYSAEFQLNVFGKTITATSFGQDIYAAIDGIKDELSKMVGGAGDKKRTLFRRGAAAVKRILKGGKAEEPEASA